MSTSDFDISNLIQTDDEEITSVFTYLWSFYSCSEQIKQILFDRYPKFTESIKKLNINTYHNGYTLLTCICTYTLPKYVNDCVISIINLLITQGININARNLYDKNTALHSACCATNHEIIELLLKHGADPNICNCDDMYPITSCVMRLNYPAVKLLIEHGSIINVPILVDNPLYLLLHTYNKSNSLKIIHSIFELLINHHDIDTNIIEPKEFYNLMKQRGVYDIFMKRKHSYKATLLNCIDHADYAMNAFRTNYGDTNIFGIIVDYLL